MGDEDIDFKMWNLYVARLLATRAVVNGRKAVAYVKNGQLQGYEYLDDFNEQCYSGPYMTFEDKKEQLRM
mgnify:CR=1 FL=1